MSHVITLLRGHFCKQDHSKEGNLNVLDDSDSLRRNAK